MQQLYTAADGNGPNRLRRLREESLYREGYLDVQGFMSRWARKW